MTDAAHLAAALDRLRRRLPDDRDLEVVAGALAAEADDRDIAARNALLHHAHREFFPSLSPTAAAERIASAIDKYRAGGWKFDQTRSEPPRDARRATWWRVLRADPRPLSERHLRRILAKKMEMASELGDVEHEGESNA
jgi:hypothetical protein